MRACIKFLTMLWLQEHRIDVLPSNPLPLHACHTVWWRLTPFSEMALTLSMLNGLKPLSTSTKAAWRLWPGERTCAELARGKYRKWQKVNLYFHKSYTNLNISVQLETTDSCGWLVDFMAFKWHLLTSMAMKAKNYWIITNRQCRTWL